ncbi:hypothetical protein CAL7716_057060 [Calothrix sp. PCC 7716]|nr:hypothetical protein CAL7716_057060 [Calothrix sp. PCC 7716]
MSSAKIPENVKLRMKERILNYAEQNYAGKYIRIEVRFHGLFCYVDAFKEPFVSEENYDISLFKETPSERRDRLRNLPIHLFRLKYEGDEEQWEMAYYSYAHNKYELSLFLNGTFYGTPEEAFKESAMYLE